jgi:hypothetical protein
MADAPTFNIDNFGWVTATGKDGCSVESQSVEAQLLYAILQRLPDPSETLPEAVEWESSDGVYRTTDKAMAANWAGAIGVRVVRRAAPVQPSSNDQQEGGA